jgi:hypothetical protein
MQNLNNQRNALLLLCAVIAALLIASLFHGHKEETWSIPVGRALAVATPCAASVAITPDPSLQGSIDIVANARNKREIAELQSRPGATAYLTGAGSHCAGQTACTDSSAVCAGLPGDPSLKLAITVPVGLALSITEARGTDYHIANVGGPLTLDLSGGGDVDDAGATSLTAALSGGGDAHIASVTGPIVATLSQGGDLDIADAAAPSANLTLSGDGDVNVAAGNLGLLNATLSHDGDLHAPAAAGARLLLTADGDVTIGEISGDLDAILTGDGDLSINNVAGDATLSASGDGDITILHVAGHLTQNNTGDGDFKVNGG